jgi:hypothetical protein
VKVEPSPGLLLTSMAPPWASAIWRSMESPNPAPPVVRVLVAGHVAVIARGEPELATGFGQSADILNHSLVLSLGSDS